MRHALKMPNAFTPNGDGSNDLIRIPPVTIQNIKSFSVFNRWGELLFRTMDSSAGWDGIFNVQVHPPGTYVWVIQYQDGLSKKVELARGTVELIR
jgi:gliding motility-associated-like protein